MKSFRCSLVLLLSLASAAIVARAQESDYALKARFETRSKSLKDQITAAPTTGTLDTLGSQIDALEREFVARRAFLDKALHPQTFGSVLNDLRIYLTDTYDKIFLIQTQGLRIEELESRVAVLIENIDSLTEQRNKSFGELQAQQQAATRLQETVKRLTATLQAKDRLIFSLLDSIFLPYETNLRQATEIHMEALGRRLDRANALDRVYEIAADNVRFLELLQLQGKDFPPLISQYQRFKQRWSGLREKITAVYATTEEKRSERTSKAQPSAKKTEAVSPGVRVDSLLSLWEAKMLSAIWSGLEHEFSLKGVTVRRFTDGETFAASIHAYVDSAKQHGVDASAFVNEIWKERIDKEWRDALTNDAILGKAAYASLDKRVSELRERKLDITLVGIFALFIALALAGWWLMRRKPKAAQPSQ